jgi:hypothetical protein
VANQATADRRPRTNAASAQASTTLPPITLGGRQDASAGFPRLRARELRTARKSAVVLDRRGTVAGHHPRDDRRCALIVAGVSGGAKGGRPSASSYCYITASNGSRWRGHRKPRAPERSVPPVTAGADAGVNAAHSIGLKGSAGPVGSQILAARPPT